MCRSFYFDDRAVDNGRHERKVVKTFMVEPDHVPDKRVFEQQRRLVEISQNSRRIFYDWKADIVQGRRPLFQKNDQEEEFVPLCVDEPGTSASLNSDRVHQVQRRIEKIGAYRHLSQHCIFIIFVVCVKNVFKEGPLLRLLSAMLVWLGVVGCVG